MLGLDLTEDTVGLRGGLGQKGGRKVVQLFVKFRHEEKTSFG